MWQGPNGYTSFPLSKAKKFGNDIKNRWKERDDEMNGYPEELKLTNSKAEGQVFGKKGDQKSFFLSKGFPICEIPSGGMASNARALAKLGAFMANKG